MKSYNVTILSKIAWNAPDWARPIKIDTSGNTLNTSLHLFDFSILMEVLENSVLKSDLLV